MNKKIIFELFDIDCHNNNIEIAIWHHKFNNYINYYNDNLCNLIDFNITIEGVKHIDTFCQNNLLLLKLLKNDTIVNISTTYGLGEIILENLKDTKCVINLNSINLFIGDFNNKYKYYNLTLYPMIDNNYYTDEKIKIYCLTNNINVIEM